MLFFSREAAGVDRLVFMGVMKPGRRSEIRVFLVDGHRIVADALTKLISAAPGFRVVAHCASLAELAATDVHDFDIALTRFLLPDGNGADVTRVIKKRWPKAKVVVLSAVIDRSATSRVRRAGADAFVGRDSNAEELLETMRQASFGKTRIVLPGSAAKRRPRDAVDRATTDRSLTPRELEVLRALDSGWTSRHICAELGIGQNTLRTHVQKIIGKLQVNSRLEAVALARREQIV